jgi:hypothetical protein
MLGLAFSLGGCGAGLITGIASSNGGGTSATVRPPELTISPVLPLVPVENTTCTVVVANSVITTGARLRVQIEAAGVIVAQRRPTVSGQGGSTAVTFTMDTEAIVSAVVNPAAADIDGRLRVLVDDRDVAPAVAIVLVRQPSVELMVGSTGSERYLSPLGERVRLRVSGLRHTDAANLQMVVSTRDPSLLVESGTVAPRILRVCSALLLEPGSAPNEVIVSAVVPGNPFPDRIEVFVRDSVSGQSTTESHLYYRPDIVLALPSQGSTTGGNLVTLIGTALVPYDFGGPGPAPLSFSAVQILLRKGGRTTPLPIEDFRTADSGLDRLVFAMPGSPDGRPGQVDVVLRVQLDDAIVEVVSSGQFLFANADPFFGPRGAVLQQLPVAVVPIGLDGAPGDEDAPDFAVLTEEGGVSFLQLLLAQENGMFQSFGARRQIGDHGAPEERLPRDMCTGDFDGDHVPDLFLANEGAATAVHHLVLGQAKPQAPLGVVHRIVGDPGTGRCRSADFDGDGLADLLLGRGPNAPTGLRPQVRLSRPLGVGQPAFAAAVMLPVRSMSYEATEVADLDGDGFLDVAVVSGTELRLDVAWGRGDGTFDPATTLDFSVQGYSPDEESPAVGLHACHNGTLQSLGLVISGLAAQPPGTGPTPPLIAVLHQSSARVFQAPQPGDVQISPTDPLGVSLAADLDQANSIELAVGVRGVPTVASVGLLRFVGTNFQPIPGGVEIGAELPRNIGSMHFGRAFPATPLSGEAKAVFIVHEILVDNQIERRLSTRLLIADAQTQSLTLLPPDAGAAWDRDVEGIVGGNFRPISVADGGAVRDLALGRANGVDLLENDGFGGFPRPVSSLVAPGLLGPTMLLLPAAAGQFDSIAYFDSSSRIGIWRPDPMAASPQSPNFVSEELRSLSADPVLRAATLSSSSRLRIADVDGDQVPDLVAFLSFVLPTPGEGQALLVILRGKADPQGNEFPFYAPGVVTPVHGNATSFALGDFSAAGAGLVKRLELALAVPMGTTPGNIDGDHVRFYRYVPGPSPELDHFEASAEAGGPQVLLAGSGPTRLAAADFDGDGLVDLLVACANDGTLRLFRNTAPVTGQQGHVAIGEFVESLSSPRQLPTGEPLTLRLGDVNGDGSLDVIAVVERVQSGQRSTSVSYYLSTEPGVFGDARLVSPGRLGDRNARLSLDQGDWNRDGVLDLFLAWNTHGNGDRNVRVLFGGSR